MTFNTVWSVDERKYEDDMSMALSFDDDDVTWVSPLSSYVNLQFIIYQCFDTIIKLILNIYCYYSINERLQRPTYIVGKLDKWGNMNKHNLGKKTSKR